MNRSELYQEGDVIDGRYEVRNTLGKGGFGIVYLAYDLESQGLVALKTFRGELLADAKARNAFKKESLLWVNLEEHPHILAARWVSEISGRLFVGMDYIAPDAKGRITLHDHLATANGPLDTNQVLGWAIQFCFGMEHAQVRELECHRDIKPRNILIAQDCTLKIADFGLAAAAAIAWSESSGNGDSLVTGTGEVGFSFSIIRTEGRMRCGTPGYMAPEVYRFEGADIRSDIYSFGVVLWQMAVGSRIPPWTVQWRGDRERYGQEIYEQQMAGCLTPIEGLLGPIIARCLRAKPSERYGNFQDLRRALEAIWKQRTGTNFPSLRPEAKTAGFWNNKGGALRALGRHEEAIECFDKALAVDRQYAPAWSNKGAALRALGRHEHAIGCYEKALTIAPEYAAAWINKSNALAAIGRHDEALECFDKALKIAPLSAHAWNNKGIMLGMLGRHEEAIDCYDVALAVDERHADAWHNKGAALGNLGRFEEVIGCMDSALAIDPLCADAWINKSAAFDNLGRYLEAIECCDRALEIDPQNSNAWASKGIAFFPLGRHDETIKCCEKAVTINPRNAKAWFNKALSEDVIRNWHEAVRSYRKFLDLAQPDAVPQIAHSRQRLRELESEPV